MINATYAVVKHSVMKKSVYFTQMNLTVKVIISLIPGCYLRRQDNMNDIIKIHIDRDYVPPKGPDVRYIKRTKGGRTSGMISRRRRQQRLYRERKQ